MPEVILCRHCKQPINKETDEFVVIAKGAERYPEALAHVACEHKRPHAFGLEEWARMFRWPSRP
jgi:hypothetical protein